MAKPSGLHLSDREAYRLYIQATAGFISLFDVARLQAGDLETTQHGELDWPDIVCLLGDLRETGCVLHRLWDQLESGGFMPGYKLPPPAEDPKPANRARRSSAKTKRPGAKAQRSGAKTKRPGTKPKQSRTKTQRS